MTYLQIMQKTWFSIAFILLSVTYAAEEPSGISVLPENLLQFYLTPNQTSTLKWSVKAPLESAAYIVRDINGSDILTGEAVKKDDTLSIDVTLPTGYYEVCFQDTGITFGLVSIPSMEHEDPIYCMDTAFSWLEKRPEVRQALIQLMKRTGISMIRERISAGAIHPAADQWNWECGSIAYETLRKQCAEQELPVLDMLYGRIMHLGDSSNFPMSRNMLGTYDTWKMIIERWQNTWGGGEVWNEPDLKKVPADHYTPLVAVASYAAQQSGMTTPLVTGVFASIPPTVFHDASRLSGMVDASDAVSFHTYNRTPEIEGFMVRYRDWLRQSGRPALPVWHTESGLPWTSGTDRAPRLEDLDCALEIAGKAIESKACGIARYFPFILVFYEEGNIKNFAMLGREVSPLRSFAAYANAIRLTGGKTYIGDLTQTPEPIKRARIFSDDSQHERIAVIYTGTIDRTMEVALPAAIRAVGIDGRELAIKNHLVPIPDGLAYVWLSEDAVINTDTTAMNLTGFTRQTEPGVVSRKASPLIIQFLNENSPLKATAKRYLVSQEDARQLPVAARITNLSDQDLTFTPALSLPDGQRFQCSQILLRGRKTLDIHWKIPAHQALDIVETRFIILSANVNEGVKPMSVAVPLTVEGTLEEHLAGHIESRSIAIGDLSRWHRNITHHGEMGMSAADGQWKLHTRFSEPGDRWVYPKLELNEGTIQPDDTGILMRARILSPARNVALMAFAEDKRENFRVMEIFPADGEWHTVYVPFDEFLPGPGHPDMQNAKTYPSKWRTLAVGFGSNQPENEMEISHFLIVNGPSKLQASSDIQTP